MPRRPYVLLVLWLLPAAASAECHLTCQIMPSGGGSVGAVPPMQTLSTIGEPFGGLASNGQLSVRGGEVADPPLPSGPPDTTPPTGSVVISAQGGSASGGNGGAAATNNPTVTLTLAATDDSGIVAQMRCSNDGVTYTPPEPYSLTKVWTLAAGDGTKTVYVRFADPSGNWSEPASDSILLDTTPPTLAISTPSDGEVMGP